ncbi:hypothetical protein DEU56DRAFT_401315 [Suillus clintonianus]|uniref:uncharacterized protein n=1 Tax=Suillus clintonianus TaxID=1904413 RepID=UPI001B8848BB|nr:uncharacterized protein DEU56DRAFT_401315 [Suillus clintonianus]KAG2135163.1 hypothetical protein DEU56DRAFT_401315 [Suillus clintonianus]
MECYHLQGAKRRGQFQDEQSWTFEAAIKLIPVNLTINALILLGHHDGRLIQVKCHEDQTNSSHMYEACMKV